MRSVEREESLEGKRCDEREFKYCNDGDLFRSRFPKGVNHCPFLNARSQPLGVW